MYTMYICIYTYMRGSDFFFFEGLVQDFQGLVQDFTQRVYIYTKLYVHKLYVQNIFRPWTKHSTLSVYLKRYMLRVCAYVCARTHICVLPKQKNTENKFPALN